MVVGEGGGCVTLGVCVVSYAWKGNMVCNSEWVGFECGPKLLLATSPHVIICITRDGHMRRTDEHDERP